MDATSVHQLKGDYRREINLQTSFHRFICRSSFSENSNRFFPFARIIIELERGFDHSTLIKIKTSSRTCHFYIIAHALFLSFVTFTTGTLVDTPRGQVAHVHVCTVSAVYTLPTSKRTCRLMHTSPTTITQNLFLRTRPLRDL